MSAEYICLTEGLELGQSWFKAAVHVRDTDHKVIGRRMVIEEVELAGRGAFRDDQGRVMYGETGNYGQCMMCGRTLNDNVDGGDLCYGCEETLHEQED